MGDRVAKGVTQPSLGGAEKSYGSVIPMEQTKAGSREGT